MNIIIYLCDIIILRLVKQHAIYKAYAILQKENQILRRQLENQGKKVRFNRQDRWFIVQLKDKDKRVLNHLSLVTPRTVLRYWDKMVKKRWRHQSKSGRPSITTEIRELVICMKKKNPGMGYTCISGNLQNIGLVVSPRSVARIIQNGRKDGYILPTGSWKAFLKSHWDSLFACDFMTVETLFNHRLYVFFLMRIKDRKIMQFGITNNPNMEFLKNQFRAFRYDNDEKIHLIHDNSGELKWFPYEQFDIKGISITPYSPNLNSYIERFHRSIRNELLDHFVVMNYRHLYNLVKVYIHFYNTMRPHQGLGNAIPDGSPPQTEGIIKSKPILFGLQHQFYRAA